jgi:hypothetical protein
VYGELAFSATYINKANRHKRRIRLTESKLLIVDEISGFSENAILRWRLIPGDYDIFNNVVKANGFELSVSSSSVISRFEIVEGWESRLYLKKTTLPVLEIEVECASVITTSIKWNIA